MSTLRQVAEITAMNLRNVPSRLGAAAVATVGITGVVTILVGVLSMSEGFRAVLQYAGRDDVAVVLRGGSNAEMSSALGLDETRIIADQPQVARDAQGPVASPELFVIVDEALRSTGTAANVPLRGVGPRAAQLRTGFRLLAGRMYTPGTYEIIVGQSALRQFAGLAPGHSVRWGSTDWRVVGVFADAGSVSQGEIWTDASILQGAYSRGNSYQSERVRLVSAASLAAYRAALKADPRLNVRVFAEREYYAEQSRGLSSIIDVAGGLIGVLMGLGAVFAALNTMYSTVAARTREIATLRAIGFGAMPVVGSVLAEALLLGAAGGLAGCLAAWLGFNGVETTTLNFASFSQVSFAFRVTPALMLRGFSYALALAAVGGALPALRAARIPVVEGLRAG